MAIGAMQELGRRRLRVPEDVALVGFDDSLIAATTPPGLTSIHQPVGDLGRQMIVRFRELVDGPGPVAAATASGGGRWPGDGGGQAPRRPR